MKWVFRFNVEGESQTVNKNLVQGFGHAMRCISLAQTFQRRYAGDALFLIQGNVDLGNYFKKFEIPLVINGDEQSILDDYHPSVIVVDINYLAPDKISWYSHWAPVVNLAPRGLPKFYADVTFNAIVALDMPSPSGISKSSWFRGPEYAIVGPDFIRFREKLESIHPRWDTSCVVVCMGGLDYHNLTASVVDNLLSCNKDLKFKIILGPYYPYEDELKQLLINQEERFQLLRDPPDIAGEIMEAGLGIFGTGVITYEALCVGVPSVNVGLTEFHQMVGKELSSLGAAVYAGNKRDLESCPLANLISEILGDPSRLEAMRCRGLELVDGRGTQRIVEKVVEMFEKQNKKKILTEI